MTVFQYLDKVRQENPQYQRLNNASLYRTTKGLTTIYLHGKH